MSNALAIAASTLTLHNLLRGAVPSNNVSLQPPDKARNGGSGDQLNLFLYQTLLSPAWRNAEMPRSVKSGEMGPPPLALNLHYLITAYGENEAKSHEVLGKAMRILHDHMVISSDDIKNATQTELPSSDLHQQIERIRITPLQMSLEETSKLWSGFQTNYRLSAAYEVSVILIESTRPINSALPVLRQGKEDRGPFAVASGDPQLYEVRTPNNLPGAPLGSVLRLLGANLEPDLKVRISNSRLTNPFTLNPLLGSRSDQLQVQLPTGSSANTDWVSGFYTVALLRNIAPLPAWASNEVAFALVPTITVAPLTAPAGDLTLTLTCKPRVRPEQTVLLIFAGQQIAPQSITDPAPPADPTGLQFFVPGIAKNPEGYPVRLRIDGVDSLPMILQNGIYQFDPNQKVVVT